MPLDQRCFSEATSTRVTFLGLQGSKEVREVYPTTKQRQTYESLFKSLWTWKTSWKSSRWVTIGEELRTSPGEVQIFGNGQKQQYLKLCLLKASHEQVIKSTLFCLLILMWSRDRQFMFLTPWEQFWFKKFLKITNNACLLSKQTLATQKSNDVSLQNCPSHW